MAAGTATDVSSLISAISRLAWPVAVIILAIVFRTTIAQQMGRLKTFKAAGTEVTFAERLDEVVRESGKLTSDIVEQVSTERQAYLSRLATTDPWKAIKGAWEMIREAAQDIARRADMDWISTKDLAERLGREGKLGSDVVGLILDLRREGGQLLLGIAATTATAYVAAATNVVDVLRALVSTPSMDHRP